MELQKYLKIVSLSRNVSHHLFPIRKSYQHTLAIGRVGFFWLSDEHLKDNTF